jgi:diguanylate cyclase (GGDEF)-like protein
MVHGRARGGNWKHRPALCCGDRMVGSRLRELERENAELRRVIGLLHQVSNLVRESLELAPTCYAVLTGVTAGVGLGLNRAMLFLADDGDRNQLRGVAAVGPADAAEADRVWKSIELDAPDLWTLYAAGLRRRDDPGELDRRVREVQVSVHGDSPIALALRSGALACGSGSDDLAGLLHLPTALAAPLRGRDAVRGVLYADNIYTGRRLEPVAELAFSLIADHAGRAIDSARKYEQIAARARTDALTGLGHHGTMMEAVQSAVRVADDQATALSLAMIDLDDFKRVNDTLGHLAGDALLAGVAARLRSVLRAREVPYRYGGEEFAVLLPGAGSEELLAIGERLRQAVAEKPISVRADQTVVVTCSIGMAERAPREDAEGLFERADRALLRAKASGKNRVVLAE